MSVARLAREAGVLARELAAAADDDDALVALRADLAPDAGAFGELFAHLACHAVLAGPLPARAPVAPSLAALFARASHPEGLALFTARPLLALRRLLDPPDARRAFGPSPELHVHEHLVAALSPGARALRGVFYTPDALVGYVVRSVGALLEREFAGASLARGTVAAIDPAAGTGAFLRALLEREDTRGSPAIAHAATRGLAGVELLPAPRAIAELVVARALARHGYDAVDRVRIRLGDALADASVLPTARDLDGRVVVVLGNPPYSGHAKSGGAWIVDLLRGDAGGASYTRGPEGASLGERNAKWLQDDYVRFLRLAHHCVVDRAEGRGGIVALVCNHGWLEHPTFRGVRHALQHDFDAIYALDLHGNARRGERAPGTDAPDGNVFGVQQGVCVVLLVRRPGRERARCAVHHAELYGTRDAKLAWLAGRDVATTPWAVVLPEPPSFAVTPARSDAALREQYARCVPLDVAMPVHSAALVTGRDGFAVDDEPDVLAARLAALFAGNRAAAGLRANDRLDASRARARGAEHARAVACLYRPLDVRHVLLHDALIERPRRAVTDLLLDGSNLALVARRQAPPGEPCAYFFVARLPVVDGAIRSDNHGSESVFPLYVRGPDGARCANLAPAFTRALCESTGLAYAPEFARAPDLARAFGPQDALAYAYAVFHTPAWRARFAPLVCQGFPRVPLPSRDAFARAVRAGHALVGLHTLEARDDAGCVPPASDARVERVRFDAAQGYVWLGERARFEGVAAAAWTHRVGAWQPLRKWLEDRAGRVLSRATLARYASVVSAVARTVELSRALEF